MARMKEQVKYYIAFAEHSAKSHAGIGSDNEVKELDALIKELQDAKVLNFKQDYLYVFKWLNFSRNVHSVFKAATYKIIVLGGSALFIFT